MKSLRKIFNWLRKRMGIERCGVIEIDGIWHFVLGETTCCGLDAPGRLIAPHDMPEGYIPCAECGVRVLLARKRCMRRKSMQSDLASTEALRRDAVMGVMATNGHAPESYNPATGQATCRYCGMQAWAVTEGGRLTVVGEAAERECWEVLVEDTDASR